MTKRYSESTWAILAGMRFILAAIVLVAHLQVFVPNTDGFYLITNFGARAAVLGFLLISGVSIGHSFKQNSEGYLRRRFLRIYPLYFFTVLLTCVLIWLVGSPYQLPGQTLVTAGWKTSVANFFLLQGFLAISVTYNGPIWTLAIEVFFYLFAPILSRTKLTLFLILIGISMITYVFFPLPLLFGYPALRYCWPWLIGYLTASQQRPKLIAVLLAVGVVVTALGPDTPEPLSSLTFALVSLVIVMANIYVFSFHRQLQSVLNFFGEISYPIYLLHFPLYILLYRFFGVRSTWQFLLLTFLLTVILNYVVDHWFKRIFWKPVVSLAHQVSKDLFGIERLQPERVPASGKDLRVKQSSHKPGTRLDPEST